MLKEAKLQRKGYTSTLENKKMWEIQMNFRLKGNKDICN